MPTTYWNNRSLLYCPLLVPHLSGDLSAKLLNMDSKNWHRSVIHTGVAPIWLGVRRHDPVAPVTQAFPWWDGQGNISGIRETYYGVTRKDRYQGQAQPDRPQDVGPDNLGPSQDSKPRNIEFTHATSTNMGSVSLQTKTITNTHFLASKQKIATETTVGPWGPIR